MSVAASLSWARSDRLAEWLGYGVSPDLVIRMRGAARLERRLADLADARLGPPPAVGAGAAVLALDELGFLGLAQRAGAIWHARRIAGAIDGASVRQLVAAIGPVLRLFAIRHVALAPADSGPDRPGAETSGLDALPAAIAAAGNGCLHAWCAASHPDVRQRLAFRLSGAGDAPEIYRASGPRIVESLLEASA